MHNKKNATTLVEVVWSDDKISQNYIERLNRYLNPYNKPNITTAMWNKEILPDILKNNVYSRFMIVFDYDDYKYYQKCFSYSSPKPNDNRTDLRYYILPNRQKVMLNTSIDIPTQYLIKADFPKMKLLETSRQILDNIDKNIENLNYVKQHKRHILEQYDTIFNNLKTIKFRQNNVQWAHNHMINNKKQHQFCLKEIQLMMISKSKQNQSNGSSSIPTNENETGADVWKKYENQQKASLKQSYIKIENNSANEDHQDKFQFETK